ncbi:hypothetical protein GSI_10030 [Ganoderma sinense ZZ0214-1]|uniref:Uncharacterized protein n=1 Tax=Ganoderma sinense ZZ0214-1 TaxID=1077348 RepID=A0A2G8RZE5_9APHY|nr:hypothetical protein GSI_10030 [Ganoderma sinense ZZ0214-1]
MTSSAGTFSPSVRLSFARRFLRVSVTVTVGVAGLPGVVGVTGIVGVRLPLPLPLPPLLLLLLLLLLGAREAFLGVGVVREPGTARRGSEGGSATALRRRTSGVGRGARLRVPAPEPEPLDFSRTWRANDLGVGRDWVDASEALESVLARGAGARGTLRMSWHWHWQRRKRRRRMRSRTRAACRWGRESSKMEPWRRLRSRSCSEAEVGATATATATGLESVCDFGFSRSPMGRVRGGGKTTGEKLSAKWGVVPRTAPSFRVVRMRRVFWWLSRVLKVGGRGSKSGERERAGCVFMVSIVVGRTAGEEEEEDEDIQVQDYVLAASPEL